MACRFSGCSIRLVETCLNRSMLQPRDPRKEQTLGGEAQGRVVLGDPGQDSAGHSPHDAAWDCDHWEQKSKEKLELPNHQGSGPAAPVKVSSEHRARHTLFTR